MKNIIKLVALSLVLVMSVLAFASCGGKEGSIKAAFEGEGYTVTTVKAEDLDTISKGMLESFLKELGEDVKNYEIMTCTKGMSIAIVLKFPSENDLKSALTVEGNTEVYDEAVEEGLINGNCLLLPLDEDVIDIFKNA